MSWDQPGLKSKEQLLESEQAQRDENIARYATTLDELQKKIDQAKKELNSLRLDIEGVHNGRLNEYAAKEDHLSNLKRDLELQALSLETKRSDLMAYDKRIIAEHKKAWDDIKATQTANLAAKDQLDALQKELDGYAAIQVETAQKQKDKEEALNSRQEELVQNSLDANKVSKNLIDDHHALKALKEEHAQRVMAHNVEADQLAADQKKNMEFYDAILAREAEIDTTKKKFEDGILANQKESERLKNQNIESYKKLIDADKRVQIAIEAEQRVKTECEKLEVLKEEIHKKIKPQEA